ncbi:MAG: substrate-binding periplasmic protein [Acidobacteriota bacterium]
MRKVWMGFVWVLVAWPALAAEPSPYIVAYNETTAPMLPLVKALYAEIGMHPTFVLVPSERAITETNRGVYDADLSRVPFAMELYPNVIHTREPLKKTELFAYVKQDAALSVSRPEDVKGHTLGMLRGSKLSEDFARRQGVTPVVSNGSESFYQMLAAGRFEIALVTSTQLLSPSDRMMTQAKRVGPVLTSTHSYHILNKRHADLVPQLDAGIRAMRADGRLARLLQRVDNP